MSDLDVLTAAATPAADATTMIERLGASREELERWYSLMNLGRILDDKAPNYNLQSLGWSYHAPCAGHDGIQIALGVTFRPRHDYLFPYYRDLSTCLAAGLSAEEILLNGMSKRDDVASGGRHMSNHFAKPEIHIQNVSSCVANHAQHAAGLGRAVKMYASDAVVFCSVGESSTSEGYFYEAVNGASCEKLPVVFVVQDNGYGIAVPKSDQTANRFASDNFSGFLNTKIIHCDGTDLFHSLRAMREAVAFAKSGAGCAIVHAECVRIHSHSGSDDHELYRSSEELAAARNLDPLPRLRNALVESGTFSEEEIAAIDRANLRTYEESSERARSAPDPVPASIFEFVLPEPWVPEGDGLADSVVTPETVGGIAAPKMTLREALNGTLGGQDVAYKKQGGIFNVTKGLQAEFGPKRVFNGPIAEDFILGTADGFSRFNDKIRIVVEGAEFADYFSEGHGEPRERTAVRRSPASSSAKAGTTTRMPGRVVQGARRLRRRAGRTRRLGALLLSRRASRPRGLDLHAGGARYRQGPRSGPQGAGVLSSPEGSYH